MMMMLDARNATLGGHFVFGVALISVVSAPGGGSSPWPIDFAHG